MPISWAVQVQTKRKEQEMSNSEDSQQYLNDMLVKDEDEASGGKRNVKNNQCFGAALLKSSFLSSRRRVGQTGRTWQHVARTGSLPSHLQHHQDNEGACAAERQNRQRRQRVYTGVRLGVHILYKQRGHRAQCRRESQDCQWGWFAGCLQQFGLWQLCWTALHLLAKVSRGMSLLSLYLLEMSLILNSILFVLFSLRSQINRIAIYISRAATCRATTATRLANNSFIWGGRGF